MSISATEISELIKKKIEGLNLKAEARTEGTVVSLSDGIARIHGLSDVMQGEMIEFAGGVQPASPTPTSTRQISSITKPEITTPPNSTGAASPDNAVAPDHSAMQIVMIQVRLAYSA